MADIEVTGPVFRVEKIEDDATPEGLALTQYNLINSSSAFTGEQKDLLNMLIACSTGFRPAGRPELDTNAAEEAPKAPGKKKK